MRSIVFLFLLLGSAHAEPVHVVADVDVPAFGLNGVSMATGADVGRWRFALALASHDIAEPQLQLSGANADLYATIPIAVEAITRFRTRHGLVVGARVGMVHFHFAREGRAGIDEEFDYGVTPFVGYEWSPNPHVYIAPWIGAMYTVARQAHGELPMEEADRTYASWPAMLRGGLAVGARY